WPRWHPAAPAMQTAASASIAGAFGKFILRAGWEGKAEAAFSRNGNSDLLGRRAQRRGDVLARPAAAASRLKHFGDGYRPARGNARCSSFQGKDTSSQKPGDYALRRNAVFQHNLPDDYCKAEQRLTRCLIASRGRLGRGRGGFGRRCGW